jgi:hypothetical protein
MIDCLLKILLPVSLNLIQKQKSLWSQWIYDQLIANTCEIGAFVSYIQIPFHVLF